MNKYCKQLIVFIATIPLASISVAQISTQTLLKAFDEERGKKLTSVKTNVLAEVLQASLSNGIITSSGSDINIKSTIFQLEKLWNPDIAIDTNYAKSTFKRNFEFGLGFKLNSDNKINGVGGSLKYAIVNNRDITRHDVPGLETKVAALNSDFEKLVFKVSSTIIDKIDLYKNKLLGKEIIVDAKGQAKTLTTIERENAMPANDKADYDKINQKLIGFGPNAAKSGALNQLGQDFGIDLLSKMGLSLKDFDAIKFDEAMKIIKEKATEIDDEIKKRALLTFSFGSHYIDNNWDSLNIKLEYLKGLGNKSDEDKPWDIYAAGFCDFKMDDVTKKALGRQVFTGKLGLNKVLIKNSNQKSSFLEILGAAELNHIAKGAIQGEEKTVFMADFTLTFRLASTVFLPIEFKYDPKNANVFGFLKVKWDLQRQNGKE